MEGEANEPGDDSRLESASNHQNHIAMDRIYVDMVGDLFHKGHVEILKAARAMGDYLIVGVLADSVVASYKRVPIMTLDERVAVILACRYVDQVIAGAPNVISSEFLADHDISYVVHGANISEKAVEEIYGVPRREGKLRLIDETTTISTTAIIQRVLERNPVRGD